MGKRAVDSMSGHCRHGEPGSSHRACHARWETPSATVTCVCDCHAASKIVGKVQGTKRVMVKKS